jgi:hypothetical protein
MLAVHAVDCKEMAQARRVGFLLDPNGPRLLFGSCWNASIVLKDMAGTTGLEPAASAVTGQRSNQLNYVPKYIYLQQLTSITKTELL